MELTAGKTIDAMINVGMKASYALYDRGLHLTNGAATGGGMLTYLDVSAAAGALQLSADTYSVAEDGGTLTVTVDRVGGSAGAVSVDYATADGTATAGLDYTAASGTLTFARRRCDLADLRHRHPGRHRRTKVTRPSASS